MKEEDPAFLKTWAKSCAAGDKLADQPSQPNGKRFNHFSIMSAVG